MAFVTIRMKGEEGHSRSDLGKDRIVVGRSSKSDVPIRHTSLSREHCAFVREGGVWLVEDLGSQNGTWVNKTRVEGRIALKERDIVKAGQVRLTFHEGDRGLPEAAVDLALDDDDDAAAPSATRGADDPPEAAACVQCGAWYSFAHRMAGERMPCPRCGHANTIPDMSL